MNVPTHNNNTLDVLLTNRPDLFDVQVGQSLVKTQHKVLIVNSKAEKSECVRYAPRHRVQVLDYDPLSAGLLRQTLARYN